MKKTQIIALGLAAVLTGSLTGISAFAANKQDTNSASAEPAQTGAAAESTSSAA